jgi:hypothetical protein
MLEIAVLKLFEVYGKVQGASSIKALAVCVDHLAHRNLTFSHHLNVSPSCANLFS